MMKHNQKTINDQKRSMTLLTKELRETLPPLYTQDGKYGKSIAYVKFFCPSSSWTWYACYAELGISNLMWSSG